MRGCPEQKKTEGGDGQPTDEEAAVKPALLFALSLTATLPAKKPSSTGG